MDEEQAREQGVEEEVYDHLYRGYAMAVDACGRHDAVADREERFRTEEERVQPVALTQVLNGAGGGTIQ